MGKNSELAISSLIIRNGSYAEPLKAIASHGKFPYVMWHHEMRSDYLYSPEEMAQIDQDIRGLGLKVKDVHASRGSKTYNIWSTDQEQRQSSLVLVENRLLLASKLGGDTIVLHIPQSPDKTELDKYQKFMDSARRTLDDLEPLQKQTGVGIALENHSYPGYVNMGTIEELLPEYDPKLIGLCLDTGHAVQFPEDLDRVMAFADRLTALHLNNNDGGSVDQHRLLYTGVLDVKKAAQVVAASTYSGPISMEVGRRHHPKLSVDRFLERAFMDAKRFANTVSREKQKLGK
jgi:sugar phosphate isomerase/epimerase